MNKSLQIVFDKSVNNFLAGNIEAFCDGIRHIEVNLSCNCFFENQPTKVWNSLKQKMLIIEYNPKDYFHNISFGFISLKSEDYYNAINFLNIAIDLNLDDALAYSLLFEVELVFDYQSPRIRIPEIFESGEIPWYSYIYAKILYESAIKSKDKKLRREIYDSALEIIDKAIINKPELSCFYSLNAILSGRYIHFDYKKCLQHKPDLLNFINLFECYYREYRSNCEGNLKAKLIAEKGKLLFPNEPFFNFALSNVNYAMGNYEESISILKNYTSNEKDYSQLKKANKLIDKNYYAIGFEIYCEAKKSFKGNDFKKVISLLNEAINNFLFLSDKFRDDCFLMISNTYFISLVKLQKPNFSLEEDSNNDLKLFNILLAKYNLKIRSKIHPTKEEEAINNLTTFYNYQSVLNFGKYKGSNVYQILDIEPEYIIWCIINLHHFSIYSSLLFEKRLKQIPQYLRAVEVNLVKCKIIENIEETYDDDYKDDYKDQTDWSNYNDQLDMDQQSEEFWSQF